jgi:hypothetical protein
LLFVAVLLGGLLWMSRKNKKTYQKRFAKEDTQFQAKVTAHTGKEMAINYDYDDDDEVGYIKSTDPLLGSFKKYKS